MGDLRLKFDVYSTGRAFHADDDTICPHGVSMEGAEPCGRLGQVVFTGTVKCYDGRPLSRMVFDPAACRLAEPNPGVQEKPGDRPAVTLPADVRELLEQMSGGHVRKWEHGQLRAAELLAKYRTEG